MPLGESADLRLDWTAPFYPHVEGALELVIAVPEDGGELRAETDGTSPTCGPISETSGEATSFLSASAFGEPATETVMDSPLARLTAIIEPVARAKPGELITFHVRLANPTTTAVPLDPCPGYRPAPRLAGEARLRGGFTMTIE